MPRRRIASRVSCSARRDAPIELGPECKVLVHRVSLVELRLHLLDEHCGSPRRIALAAHDVAVNVVADVQDVTPAQVQNAGKIRPIAPRIGAMSLEMLVLLAHRLTVLVQKKKRLIALKERRFTGARDDDVKKVLGGNFMRVFRRVWI